MSRFWRSLGQTEPTQFLYDDDPESGIGDDPDAVEGSSDSGADDGDGGVPPAGDEGGDAASQAAADTISRTEYDELQSRFRDLESSLEDKAVERAEALLREIVPDYDATRSQTSPGATQSGQQGQRDQSDDYDPDDPMDRLKRLEKTFAQDRQQAAEMRLWTHINSFRERYPMLNPDMVYQTFHDLRSRGYERVNIEKLAEISHQEEQKKRNSFFDSRLGEIGQAVEQLGEDGDLDAVLDKYPKAKAVIDRVAKIRLDRMRKGGNNAPRQPKSGEPEAGVSGQITLENAAEAMAEMIEKGID